MDNVLTARNLHAAHYHYKPAVVDQTTFDSSFERLYWKHHPLGGVRSATDDIYGWWTCVDFGAFLINAYAHYGYDVAVEHLKAAGKRTVALGFKHTDRWNKMESLMEEYEAGLLEDRLAHGVMILRILTENERVTPKPVRIVQNVPGTVLHEGAIISDWQNQFITVNHNLENVLEPTGYKHTFEVSWPLECQQITAWQTNGAEWVLPQGYTFELNKRLGGGTAEFQHWTATAIPPTIALPAKPMQAMVKPTEVPQETLDKIRKFVRDDLERRYDYDEDEEHGTTINNVHEAFEQVKTSITTYDTPRLPAAQDFDYYPNIEEFFDLAEFTGLRF
jgi:hypothetical protein